MAPIYDTDLEEDRFEKEEWKNFELWEKINLRLKKQRRLVVISAIILFFLLSSISVIIDRAPYWKTVSLAAEFSKELIALKRQAVLEHKAIRIRFLPESQEGEYVIERLVHCQSESAEIVRSGFLQLQYLGSMVKKLSQKDAEHLQIGRVSDQFCYAPLDGAFYGQLESNKAVFAFVFVKDLTLEKPRSDRITVLTVENLTADISFN